MENSEKLERLKKIYLTLQEKYSLPDFMTLNRDFLIEKISENETDFVLREVRKYMGDKLFGYLRFIESLINPTNAPMFVFAIVKTLGNEQKEKLAEIYKKITLIEVEFLELDLNYSEEKESESIKKYLNLWNEIKGDLSHIIDFIKKNLNNKSEDKSKGYFG
jgi:hypothetical protein